MVDIVIIIFRFTWNFVWYFIFIRVIIENLVLKRYDVSERFDIIVVI